MAGASGDVITRFIRDARPEASSTIRGSKSRRKNIGIEKKEGTERERKREREREREEPKIDGRLKRGKEESSPNQPRCRDAVNALGQPQT